MIAVGRNPTGIAYGEGSVWVANRGGGTISQIDATSQHVIRTIHLGYRPAGITVGAGAVWATARRVSATAAATGLLAFDDNGQIYTSRPDGSQRRQLTHTRKPIQNIEPAWSPDGRRIAFLRVRRGKQNSSVFALPELMPVSLYVMNADGTRQRRIPQTNDPEGGAPAWSPDGSRIAFSAGNPGRIYTIEPDGTHRTRIAAVPAKSYDVAWSPDGSQIGFDSNAHMLNGQIFNIYTVQSDGTHLRRITNIPSQYVEWSPDGRRIVFNRYTVNGRLLKFLGEYMAPASGGPGVRLLPATNKYPGSENPGPAVVSWSPDGTAIVVSGLPDATPPAIYIANIDGSGLTYVSRGNDATWRPTP